MPADDLRFSRLEQLPEIALDLQGSLSGVSLDGIIARYSVSRRTAMRMLSSVRRAVGEVHFEYDVGDDGRKRWRLTRPAVTGLFRLTAGELAALDQAGQSSIDVSASPGWQRRWRRCLASCAHRRRKNGGRPDLT